MDKYNPKNNIFVIAVKNKKKIFHVLDFIYISNNSEFKKYGHNLCTQIGSEFNVMFCGQHFLHEKDALIPEKKLITKDIKSEVFIKNLPVNYNFDTLYSEFVY
jgi:RNA recognition motif-containing protein